MSQTTNQARIDFRASMEIKSLITRAAALNGMSVSEFIKSTVVEKSREVIERNERHVLSDRDRDIFLAVLDAPASPNPALLEAAAEFKRAVGEGKLIP